MGQNSKGAKKYSFLHFHSFSRISQPRNEELSSSHTNTSLTTHIRDSPNLLQAQIQNFLRFLAIFSATKQRIKFITNKHRDKQLQYVLKNLIRTSLNTQIQRFSFKFRSRFREWVQIQISSVFQRFSQPPNKEQSSSHTNVEINNFDPYKPDDPNLEMFGYGESA